MSLCEAFNQNKGQKVISILDKAYSDADVIFIQVPPYYWVPPYYLLLIFIQVPPCY